MERAPITQPANQWVVGKVKITRVVEIEAGDIIHNPIQFADPGICSIFDGDRAVARTTRTSFIHCNANQNVLVLGSHFATPSAGYIVHDKNGWRFVGDAETFKA